MSIEHTVSGNRRVLKTLLTTLVVITAALLGWRYWPSSPQGQTVAPQPSPKTEAKEEDKLPANRVQLSPEAIQRSQLEYRDLVMHDFRQTLEVTGRLALNEDASARVGTFVGGRVTRVLATVGDPIKKGQALIYIHSHELLDARADEGKARAIVIEKEKALAYANAELERANRLLEAKAVSKREQAHAAANTQAAAAELDHAKAELTRAAEWLEHLTVPHDSHDDIVIYAPTDGVVLQRLVTLGTVVAENSDLVILGNLSSLWAMAEVPEAQAAFIRIGEQIEMTVPAFGDDRFIGRVAHLGAQLNPDTRTVQVRCLVNNPTGKLRPEMYAKVSIRGNATQSVLALPRDAVQEMQGEQVVFRAMGDSVFEKISVQLGREQNGLVEILSGLSVGQRIVTRGGFFIKSEFLKSTLAEE